MDSDARPRSIWSDGRPLACGLALLAGLVRLVPYPIYNFTPIGALGVFGGARLKWWQAFSLPMLVMVVTDLALWKWKGWSPFDPFVYGCIALNVVLGRLLLARTESPLRIGAVSLLASLQFFVVTNFGVWLTDCYSAKPMYSASWSGLLKCYALGLAFYKTEAPPFGFLGNAVVGDVFFVAVLFGAHAFLSRRAFPAERVAPAPTVLVAHG